MRVPAAIEKLSEEAQEIYKERAAIMEFDGGLSRNRAEKMAVKDTLKRFKDNGEWK